MYTKYTTKLTHLQIVTAIASISISALLIVAYNWKPETAIYFPSLHRSVVVTPSPTASLPTSAAVRPTVAMEQVDTHLGQRQVITGTVLGGTISTQAVVSLAPAYAVTTLTCDIVFDFKLTDAVSGQVSYEMYVTNRGSGLCDDASLTLYYSNGERFLSATPAPQSGYYWRLGDMNSSEQRAITLTTVGAAVVPSNTEGCATAHNGSDSCTTAIQVAAIPVSTPTPIPTPTATPIPTSAPTPTQIAPNTSDLRPVAQDKFYGTWVWDDVYKMSDANILVIVNKVAAGGFDTIYLTVDKYLELNAISNKASRTTALNSYADSLSKFISLANTKGIRVYAEAGWKDWAENGKRAKAISILQYVQNFNAGRPEKFAGVQYDIEPYLLSTYERNKASVLTNFVTHVAEIVAANQSVKLPLEFVIPHFYDCMQKWTPNITYNGKSDCTFNHLLAIVDKSPKSTISIMAYRNFADGDNSVLKLVQEELKQSLGRSTKIVIAQETGDVDPGYVTYFGTGKSYMYSEFAKIVTALGDLDSFGGMAVHYIDPFTALGE